MSARRGKYQKCLEMLHDSSMFIKKVPIDANSRNDICVEKFSTKVASNYSACPYGMRDRMSNGQGNLLAAIKSLVFCFCHARNRVCNAVSLKMDN